MSDRLVVMDMETTGLDERVHDVCQFAAVAVGADWSEVDAIELKVFFDESKAEPAALELNGYDPEVWKREAAQPAIARGRIADFLRKHATVQKMSARTGRPYTVARVCGHNASTFDGRFLAAWFKRADQFLPAACYEALDTLALARWATYLGILATPENHKLETLCLALGIEHGGPHEALADVRATVELARRLSAAMVPAAVGR